MAGAASPEDLARQFFARANAGDVDGVVALYEPDALLASPDGHIARGTTAIREVYAQLLAARPTFAGEVRPALVVGNLALTSSRFRGGATAEVARRQADGTWLWVIDQPRV